MANVALLTPFILRWEGGYVDDPDDAGGATNMGVTLSTWKAYCKAHGKTGCLSSLKRLSHKEWERVFKWHSWDAWRADEIASQRVANICVDWSWMSGRGVIKRVQRLLGVTADGIVGKQTLAAINGMSGDVLFARIKQERKAYYDGIVRARPANSKFLRGWLNRLDDLARL